MNMRSLLPNVWQPANGSSDLLSALRQEIDRAFESFGRSLPGMDWPKAAPMPKINVTQKDKALVVTAELPGVDSKDVDVLVDRDMLTIRGEKKQEKEDKSGERHVFECTYGAFSRVIPLPFEAEAKGVSAAFKNGVLTVSISIPAEAQPRAKRIEIKPAS